MIPKNRISTHPGQILFHEFLEPMGISQTTLSRHLGIPIQRINEIVKGKRGITSSTAWLLADAFGTTPQFWTSLQALYDLSLNRPSLKVARIVPASS